MLTVVNVTCDYFNYIFNLGHSDQSNKNIEVAQGIFKSCVKGARFYWLYGFWSILYVYEYNCPLL